MLLPLGQGIGVGYRKLSLDAELHALLEQGDLYREQDAPP